MKPHKSVVYRHREAVTCCPECQSKDEKDNLSTAASAWWCMVYAHCKSNDGHTFDTKEPCLFSNNFSSIYCWFMWMAVLDSSGLSKQ